jgi:hypothetical protein
MAGYWRGHRVCFAAPEGNLFLRHRTHIGLRQLTVHWLVGTTFLQIKWLEHGASHSLPSITEINNA